MAGRYALLSRDPYSHQIKVMKSLKMKKASDSEGNEKGTSDATRLRFTRESASKGVRRCAEPEPGMFARWASLLPTSFY